MRRTINTLLAVLCTTVVALRSQTTEIAGVINSYARVIAIDYCANTITVDNTAGFTVGEGALLVQMKGAVIDTSNTPRFGSILDYRGAGGYELVTIAAVTGTVIRLRETMLGTYEPKEFVQIISMPRYENAAVTGTLKPKPWDGTSGGIIALDVAGTLTLHADIDATGAGFRGGKASRNYDINDSYDTLAVPCSPGLSAWKGESIALPFQGSECGRGSIANGGGGGNITNAGGGGGANMGVGGKGGGEGGWGFNGDVGGIGGYSVREAISGNRIFCGGGGGGGHQNNNQGTDGGNGGGIVIVRAGMLVGNGHRIVASGIPPETAGIDGAGGGGSGGTIILDVGAFSGQFLVEAQGAHGGNTDSDNRAWDFHPPGGGGGGGLILTIRTDLPRNVPKNVSGGAEGRVVNENSSRFNSSYHSTSGTEGSILGSGPLVQGTLPFSPLAIPETPDQVLCAGTFSVPIGARATGGSGSYRYRWQPSTGLHSDTVAIPRARPDSSTVYVCTVTDARGCAAFDTNTVTVIQSGLRIVGLTEEGLFVMDTIPPYDHRCRDLVLKNSTATPLIIDRAMLPRNLEFSLPPSQFPLTIPPGTDRSVTICFAPRAPSDYTDTLTLDLGCSYVVPLKGTSPLLTLTGNAGCSPTIMVQQVPDSLYILRVGIPYPNPAGETITVPIERHASLSCGAMQEECRLLNALGFDVATGVYQQSRSRRHATSIEEAGAFIVDGADLSPGLYFVAVTGTEKTIIHPVIISR